MRYAVTRKLEIDAGHRVPNHAGKCRNTHGHRYVVEATFSSSMLKTDGADQAMVVDFSVLKDLMVKVVDIGGDHAIMLWKYDPLIDCLMGDAGERAVEDARKHVQTPSSRAFLESSFGKICVLSQVPTAEFLAQHWCLRLRYELELAGDAYEDIEVDRVRVYETPNCWADYPVG